MEDTCATTWDSRLVLALDAVHQWHMSDIGYNRVVLLKMYHAHYSHFHQRVSNRDYDERFILDIFLRLYCWTGELFIWDTLIGLVHVLSQARVETSSFKPRSLAVILWEVAPDLCQ
jgi:hypothetical protein